MTRPELRRIIDFIIGSFNEIERELGDIETDQFPRVRIVFEFEAPDKTALEIRKRRPWK